MRSADTHKDAEEEEAVKGERGARYWLGQVRLAMTGQFTPRVFVFPHVSARADLDLGGVRGQAEGGGASLLANSHVRLCYHDVLEHLDA